MNRICYVGRNVWVGAQAMCDDRPRPFSAVLHIVSEGQRPCAKVGPIDLVETMTERIPLGDRSRLLLRRPPALERRCQIFPADPAHQPRAVVVAKFVERVFLATRCDVRIERGLLVAGETQCDDWWRHCSLFVG